MARSISESAMHKLNTKNLSSIKQQLAKEADYLNIMQSALNLHDYLTIYKLLNPTKYNAVVGAAHATSLVAQPNLIVGFQDSLSHYLGKNLTGYLTQAFPFLYFDEYKLGKFHIYFGDWWDHKLFGDLDVLNVKFQFNIKEYNKLRNKFLSATASGMSSTPNNNPNNNRLMAQHQLAKEQARKTHQEARANANRQSNLQKFSEQQNRRDSLKLKLENRLKANDAKTSFFNNRKRKAKHAVLVKELKKINQEDDEAFRKEMILKKGGAIKQPAQQKSSAVRPPKLSSQLQAKASQNNAQAQSATKVTQTPMQAQTPEQTILKYECESIRKYFGNLTQFSEKSRQIYHDYIMYLVQQAQDKATISATNMAISKNNSSSKSKSSKNVRKAPARKSTRKRKTTTRKRRRRRRTTRRKSSTRRKTSRRKATSKRKTTRRRRK